MTSEPDSTPRRRPPTIDLTATEVDAEKPAAAQEPSQEPAKEPAAADAPSDGSSGQQSGGAAAGRPRSRVKATVAGAVLGAIAVVAIGAGLWFGGYVPPGLLPASPSAQPTNSAAIAEISARLNKIEGAIATQQQQQKPVSPPQPDPALISRLAAAEAATKSQSDSLAALTRRTDDVAAAAQTALAQAKSASTAADAAKSAAQTAVARSDLEALAARIATLESTVKTLADGLKHETATADDRAARLAVAAEALRATIERGAPYPAELAAAKSLGADPSATAPLEPFAAAGVPAARPLAHELASLIPALRQAAEPASSDSSFLSRLESNAQHLVRITPIDAPLGDDPASVVTRISVDATHADIVAALADIAKLPDAAKPLAAAWVEKAQARNAAIVASRKLAADALAALSKPNPQ
ncbi:MAG TPA: hypothetical protein VK591_07070 [Xanthobacteraceae bacterium]|nr:hypothetical protein [Xanthobacteraceae bacterium]